MAAALQHLPPDNLSFNLDSYPRRLTVNELDFQDSRYPTLSSSSKHRQAASYSTGSQDTPPQDQSRASWVEYAPSMSRASAYGEAWGAGQRSEEPSDLQRQSQLQTHDADRYQQDARRQDGSGGSPYPHHDGFEARLQRIPSNNNAPASSPPLQAADMGQRASGMSQYRDQQQYAPPSPRHPALPAAGVGSGPNSSAPSPIVPASAGPSYSAAAAAAMSIPISPKPRAYAQQPTYITPASAAPSPINPVYNPPPLRQEEVCVECAMRDQDMADVDVTSPRIWERESDAPYEDLLRRELEDEANGVVPTEPPTRPRARGGRLTEENLKLWLSVNPKEPSSRQQTLDQYVKSQRALLEAEAMAHARAMRESRILDDKMRDAYSQLRRSAYELGSSAQPTDDIGGVRIKAPRSVSTPIAAVPSQHREVTLLENGMIVEHVDVRREEREERERRKRDERRDRSRVRKTSRGSRAADVMSVYSVQTPMQTDSGFFSGTKNDSRLSQSIHARPSSVMTAGGERPLTMLRAQSQASFSDMQSIGSGTSPRRSRFFGLRNLSSGWRSQDSLAPSGSMIDMHVALQREQQYLSQFPPNPDVVDIGSNAHTLRGGEPWPRTDGKPDDAEARSVKKLKGLKKFWKLVTGTGTKNAQPVTSRPHTRSLDRTEDDAPLAPPPPLSYLVDQGARRHHGSTPSLPLALPQNTNTLSPYVASPQSTPSSLQPSPTSSRRSTADREGADGRKQSDSHVPDMEDGTPQLEMCPEFEPRGRTTHSSWTLSSSGPATPPLSASPPVPRPMSTVMRRDKSLPPLPGESTVDFPNHPMPEGRPQTVFTYDPRAISAAGLLPPQAPFRTAETRRQSFGGIGSKTQKSYTMPSRGVLARGQVNVPPFLAEEKYGEFGMSRMSVGQWPAGQLSQGSLQVPGDRPKKRKSKFGLSSLFSRKSVAVDDTPDPLDLSALRMSQVESPYDPMVVNGTTSGYASPISSGSHAPRMSVASKKNLDELIDQDPEFIAYRYPSNDQRLDLLR